MDQKKEEKTPNGDEEFCNILVAKHSPENNCFVEDGAILTIIPRKNITIKTHINHYFVDSIDRETKSKYGWVKKIDKFSLGYFVEKYANGSSNVEELNHIRILLKSIASLAEDTPVAATYAERGIGQKRMDFTVHRVFFRE